MTIRETSVVASRGDFSPSASLIFSRQSMTGPVINGGIGERAEHQKHHQRRQIAPLAPTGRCRSETDRATVPRRACLRRCQRFRADRRGCSRGKTCNPCCSTSAAGKDEVHSREHPPRPRMQSLVWHETQTCRVEQLDLQRRHQRLHEIELADRTHILAERSRLEKTRRSRTRRRNKPDAIQAVNQGLSQRANASYAHRKATSSTTATICSATSAAKAGPPEASGAPAFAAA